MAKGLTQQEIDAIVGAARRGQTLDGVPVPEKSVQPCNFRASGQLSNEHARTLTALHENFARNVTNSIGAYLRASFETVLASVEQLTFSDFMAGIQDPGYVVPLNVTPAEVSVLLQADLALAFPMIDLLLGGIGSPAPAGRQLTEIDEEIMQGIATLIARQIEYTWQALSVSLKVDKCLKSSQVQEFLPPTEKVILIMFEIRTAGITGTMNLIFPASLANSLLRMSTDPKRRSKMRYIARPTLRDRVYECEFMTLVGLPHLRLRVRDVLDLKPGSVLKLHVPVKSPATLILEGRDLFEAHPVRSGVQRAAQVGKQLPQALAEELRK